MQTWAKRGIQTALVTGGLLMLGTGIASADENVNPDTPAGPLDLNASIPIDISKNAIGTLGKQVDVPEIKKDISTEPVTGLLNKALDPVSRTGALRAASPVTGAVNGLAGKVTDAAGQTGQRIGQLTNKEAAPVGEPADDRRAEPDGDALMGNKVAGNVVVPIQITGNAIGLLGNASADSDSMQTYAHRTDVHTSGAGGGVSGNAVSLDWALPVQIAGNGIGVAGRGRATGSATQAAAATGNVSTSGSHGGLSGNVVSPQGATPVQISGNAIGGILGHGESNFDAASDAFSGGWIRTHGWRGAGSGNVAGVPVALPLKLSDNAASLVGDSDVPCGSSIANATAGDLRPGMAGTPTYINTDGDDSFLSGTVAQPQAAVPGTLAGNAASVIGNSVVGDGMTGPFLGSDATAGGFSSTTGQNSAISGTIVDAPAAVPAEVFCLGAGVVGNGHARGCDNDVAATAGGATYTNGNSGFLAANDVSAQPAGTAELFGVGTGAAGKGSGSATETKDVSTGGYNGSQGNESAGSGNIVQVPVSVPGEVFGTGGSVLGEGSGEAAETKRVSSGGGGNTQDDHGTVSANLLQVPLSTPLQAYGIGGSLIGRSAGSGITDTTSTAGGTGNANGKRGLAAGNLGALPLSVPTQLHGLGVGGLGEALGAGQGTTESTAGGRLTATGEGGAIAGNIIEGPGAAVAQAFGNGAVLGGLAAGDASNDVQSTAGGSAETNGDRGAIAGNIVGAELMPIARVFGNAVSVLGLDQGGAVNTVTTNSGGDKTTSGMDGTISGDIFDLPLAAIAQVFGDAISVGGAANAIADNDTFGTVGGAATTSGPSRSLSGGVMEVPVGVVAQVFDIPLGLLGVAHASTTNDTDVEAADQQPQVDLPISMPELPATGLPSLPDMGQTLPLTGLPFLSDMGQMMPLTPADRADLPSLPQVSALPVDPSGLGNLASLSGVPDLPVLPDLLGSGLPQLPGAPALPTDTANLLPQADVPAMSALDSGSLFG
ncbi:beta strand repeat-containing protein [Amycolatopsis taiwanensis]|uniref:PE-PGRS family protein n=1 Tax=Amycolatopsis taiwanensis TaxID=342230 RepID=A0A9W6R4T6_9PSEU|nr:hypothetical protein [Amycolatopsis taiwanensis]GLY67495.1 hypothetical protein Atai01_41140 [Amycolatopsis taiwanensis]